MSSGKVKCTCGWSWNKSDSSKKDMYICHECGRDNSNNMKNGGWLDSYADGGTMQEHQENYNDPQVSLPEGFVGMGNNTKGRNYSPAWGGQFQDGGAIYVSSENDPRYKSYADSLYNYNLGNKLKGIAKSIPSLVEIKKGSPYDKALQKTLMKSKNRGLVDNTKNPNSKSIDPRVQALMKEYQKKGNKGIKPIRYNSFIDDPDNAAMDIITGRGLTDLIGLTKERSKGYNLPEWKKPKQKVVVKPETKKSSDTPVYNPSEKRWEVEGTLKPQPKQKVKVVQPDLPRVEAINLPSIQNQLVSFPNQEIDVRTPAQAPTSFDISSQRYNMQGPSDYYNYNKEDVDYETALRAQQAAEKYNTDIEKRYGPQNEYRTEKSRQEAARRLEKLRQDVKVRPNYQMGGSVYPVNYVPQAQDGGNVNNEDYNMKRALELGYTADKNGHWPSVDYETGEWLKSKKHHTRGMELMAYELNPELRNKYNLIENEKGKLQYVPKSQKIEEYQIGGSIPGSVGFTYARTNNPAPSNGPYAKKTKASAKDGMVIEDDMGQWAHPGEITKINSPYITMKGVPYPVLGISDEGDVQMMYPEEEYEFVGKKVTEFPMAKNGLRQEQKGLVNLDQLTNFTNYNTKQPGGWLDNY